MRLRNAAIVSIVVLLAAAGIAVLLFKLGGLGHSCSGVAEADRRNYSAALADFGKANKALSARNYPQANTLMDRAIADLSNSYTDRPGEDDTVTVLAAAKGAVLNKDFQLAAHIKQEVMSTRFAAFQKQGRMAERCHNLFHRMGVKAES